MKNLADLISAIATLLWPLFAFVVVYTYKGEITDLMRRIKRAKLLGQDLELDKSLDKLADDTNAFAASVPELATVTAQNELTENDSYRDNVEEAQVSQLRPDEIRPVQEILKLASVSPKLGLMQLSAEVDKEVRRHLAASGNLSRHKGILVRDILTLNAPLPGNVVKVLDDFQHIRNKIVHGHEASKDDILRAIDSGLTILRAINQIPVTKHVVYDPNVELYADAYGSQPLLGSRGVILDTIDPHGTRGTQQVFPTTRTHFEKGRAVAWEWNLDLTWGETWYRDPDTGEIRYGWTTAGEFIGRNLDEI